MTRNGAAARAEVGNPEPVTAGFRSAVGNCLAVFGRLGDASIRVKLLAAAGGIAGLTVMATAVSFLSYQIVGGGLSKIETESLPGMTHAFALTRQAADLAAISTTIAAADNIDDLNKEAALLTRNRNAMQASLQGLASTELGRRKVDQLRQESQELGDGADRLAAAMHERFRAQGTVVQLLAGAGAAHRKLAEKTAPLSDDAYFNLVMGLRRAGKDADRDKSRSDLRRLADDELELLDGLSELRVEANLLLGILTEISLAPSAQLLPPLRDSLLAAEVRAGKAVAKLERTEHARDLKTALAGLTAFGNTNTGILHQRGLELSAIARGWELVAINAAKSAELTSNVEAAAEEARQQMHQAIGGSGAAIAHSKIVLLAIIVVCLVTLAAGWIFINRSIVLRLRRLRDAVIELAAGNLEVEVPKSGQDELSDMAGALETFKTNAVDKLRLEREAHEDRVRAEQARQKAEQERQQAAAEDAAHSNERARAIEMIAGALSRLADKDLSYRLGDDMPDAYRQIRDDFNRMSEEVCSIIVRIADASTAVHGATTEIASGVSDLSVRTEHQASSLEETAASMEELTATVRQNASNAQEANKLASAARLSAASGSEIASKAVAAIDKVEGSSRQISDIVGLIQEIAFQTNLLALNAAVEAARAGDAGRGFAVVANEVRALAQRAAQASKDIKQLIVSSEAQVKDGVGLVKQAGDALREIATSVVKVADFVSEIAAASQEQASGIYQVSKTVGSMDEATQQNAALVEETNAALHSAQSQVDELRKAVGFFKTGANTEAPRAAARPAVAKPAAPGMPAQANPVHRQQGMLARRMNTRGGVTAAAEDWKEF